MSVNVDSKDIKQESQENSYVNQNTFVNANMNADASHASGQQTNNDIGDMDFNEHDFDVSVAKYSTLGSAFDNTTIEECFVTWFLFIFVIGWRTTITSASGLARADLTES